MPGAKFISYVRDKSAKAFYIYRSEGLTALRRKLLSRGKELVGRRRVYLGVGLEDVEEADWVERRTRPRIKPIANPKIIGWVVPPVGPGSGGHLNIFNSDELLG